jgi:hypothetical protein
LKYSIGKLPLPMDAIRSIAILTPDPLISQYGCRTLW